MVMKYAQAEEKNIELAEKLQKAETAVKDSAAEKENLNIYLNSLRADKQKLKDLLEKRVHQSQIPFNNLLIALSWLNVSFLFSSFHLSLYSLLVPSQNLDLDRIHSALAFLF